MKLTFGWILVILALLAAIALAVSGPLYQQQTLALGQAFTILRWAAIGGGVLAALLVLYLFIVRPPKLLVLAGIVGIVAGAVSFYIPYQQYQIAQSVPRIHDITTDIENPPEFVAIAPLRADAPNPVEYAGPETAEQQRQAYPEIKTVEFDAPANEVFAAALALAEQQPTWELVDHNVVEGRIEATATTKWFGFKDDVVMRITQGENSSYFDMRSKSRVGLSDVGVNAARINAFVAQLQTQLSE